MKRIEFDRVEPESVGISSKAIEHMLDRLEDGVTEMHGIQIMRHDKICAEGWWAPYAPGICHGLQSLSKTYSATAVGIACYEGILHLNEKIIDIFPEEVPENPNENLRMLQVKDVLCMGCGMESIPAVTSNWISEFLATPVLHRPGSVFRYNSLGSTLLCAMVERRSGLLLPEYLKSRLFDWIGVDADNLKYEYMPDGTVYGGGGFYATTEDNLRLMKLYKDDGICEGHRILSKEYVKLATSKQIHSDTEILVNPEARDNFLGYGYQIWMCQPDGVYRADGAMGQFAIVCPKQDMIISITETADGAHWAQNTLDVIWEFLESVQSDQLSEDHMAAYHLERRMHRLALPVAFPVVSHQSEMEAYISEKTYHVYEGQFGLETNMERPQMGQHFLNGIESFRMKFEHNQCRMTFLQMGKWHMVTIPTDGSRRWNLLNLPGYTPSQVYLSGTWREEKCFCVIARWIETCYENELSFFFEEDHVQIHKKNCIGRFRVANNTWSMAEIVREGIPVNEG